MQPHVRILYIYLFKLQEFLIRQLGNVMTIVQLNTKEFAHEVIDLLITHWWIAPNVQRACIGLLSPMSSVLGAEFRTYLTRLIPTILRMFHHESNESNLIAVSVDYSAYILYYLNISK